MYLQPYAASGIPSIKKFTVWSQAAQQRTLISLLNQFIQAVNSENAQLVIYDSPIGTAEFLIAGIPTARLASHCLA
ncbi:hypothetical protein [Candidatus Enterococcus huntleyi]|uniref:hypothetical protein n=1 Tax=Candidatus Enterococcus huntleyi TaxID=1857217 RepID=UPI001379EEFE|nr:hypothetical protein [Enterococcus sp. JM4C]